MLELNHLYNLDCMEGMKDFPDKFFDLAIVDPPYGIGNFTEKKYTKHKDFDWNNSIPPKEYFAELFRVSQNQIIWGANYYTEFLYPTKSWVVWDKHVTVKNGHARCELAWTSLNKVCDLADIVWTAGFYSAGQENLIHPCQKPIALYKWILKNYAKPDFKIIDTHAGSCSSVIAFEDFGCQWIAFEIDKDYYEAALKRIEIHKAQLKLAI